MKEHPADSDNADRRNFAVAKQVAEIYFEATGKEPPKAGADGPFQRLLAEVFAALGRHKVDLRGPLKAVHEFRKQQSHVTDLG